MIGDILQKKIEEHNPANSLEQENVLQELMQHFVLASLARAGFFSEAMFHGGTCLKILYGMDRFSEDLDFLLKKVDPTFRWRKYLDRVREDYVSEGIHFEILDKSDLPATVKKAFLKTDSISKLLVLELPFPRHSHRKFRIKLEIDSNPPEGSGYETRYISFPTMSAVTAQDLQSGFATKSHALLCREYTKGRDWYDFLWYVARKVTPDYTLLGNALNQQGPWATRTVRVTSDWYLSTLRSRINEIDWDSARNDVQQFIPLRGQEGLALWNRDFFLYHADQLKQCLSDSVAR